MKLLQSERIGHSFKSPRKNFQCELNGKVISIVHNSDEPQLMLDGRLQAETELLFEYVDFTIGGGPAEYKCCRKRDQKGYDGVITCAGNEEIVSCRNVTKSMEGYLYNAKQKHDNKKRGLTLHKAIGTGGCRVYSSVEKEDDIKNVKWTLFSDIRDLGNWWFYLVENELILDHITTIPQESYKYNWSAEDFDLFVMKHGYIKQELKLAI